MLSAGSLLQAPLSLRVREPPSLVLDEPGEGFEPIIEPAEPIADGLGFRHALRLQPQPAALDLVQPPRSRLLPLHVPRSFRRIKNLPEGAPCGPGRNVERLYVQRTPAYRSEGDGISTPYLGATARSISTSSSPKGGGDDASVPGLPTSSKNFSSPAGTIKLRNLAGVAPTFL